MVAVPLVTSEEALVVPWSAVVYDIDGGTWVYTVVDAARLRPPPGRGAPRDAADLAVLARGPAAGHQVVTAGAAELFGTEFGRASERTVLKAIVVHSLHLRLAVVVGAVVLAIAGFRAARQAPLDVFPEFAPPLVEMQTEAPGLSTDEVESLVTVPIESALCRRLLGEDHALEVGAGPLVGAS